MESGKWQLKWLSPGIDDSRTELPYKVVSILLLCRSRDSWFSHRGSSVACTLIFNCKLTMMRNERDRKGHHVHWTAGSDTSILVAMGMNIGSTVVGYTTPVRGLKVSEALACFIVWYDEHRRQQRAQYAYLANNLPRQTDGSVRWLYKQPLKTGLAWALLLVWWSIIALWV